MSDSAIRKIKAREILDSRGNPTVEVGLEADSGVFRDSVPSGASTGKNEAVELRDGEKRYGGKGVLKAVGNINEIISEKIVGMDPSRQGEIDKLMIESDGTENKGKLGANAICAVSMAVCRAGAAADNLPLYEYIARLAGNRSPAIPRPCFNVINGGAHAGNDLDVQEFIVVPQWDSFSENLRGACEIYHALKEILIKSLGRPAINVGDEGGFAPPLKNPGEALGLICEAAESLGYREKLKIILDVAASQFFSGGKYKMRMGTFTEQGLLDYYSDLISEYPILGLEDPFSEDDWEGFRGIAKKHGGHISIIGDDLLTTNSKRIKEAREKEACNAMILKVNQIGTITEAIEAAKLAKSYGWKVFVKHRSGETNDDFIADLAAGLGADGIMAGAPARGERVAKYNRLSKIEEEINNGLPADT